MKYELNDYFDSKEKYEDESTAVYRKKYENMTKKEVIDRYIESHEEKQYIEKVREYLVKPHQKMSDEIKKNLDNLIKSAKYESEIQTFLEQNPFILSSKTRGHHGQICIPKPKLGNQKTADFFIAGLDSAGWWWYGVELENPTFRMFNKNGDSTSELNHAIHQIEDWRSWLTKNLTYARNELGYKQIDGDLPCFIIIGRRENEVIDRESLQERQRSVMKRDKNILLLHHYEWLLDEGTTFVGI